MGPSRLLLSATRLHYTALARYEPLLAERLQSNYHTCSSTSEDFSLHSEESESGQRTTKTPCSTPQQHHRFKGRGSYSSVRALNVRHFATTRGQARKSTEWPGPLPGVGCGDFVINVKAWYLGSGIDTAPVADKWLEHIMFWGKDYLILSPTAVRQRLKDGTCFPPIKGMEAKVDNTGGRGQVPPTSTLGWLIGRGRAGASASRPGHEDEDDGDPWTHISNRTTGAPTSPSSAGAGAGPAATATANPAGAAGGPHASLPGRSGDSGRRLPPATTCIAVFKVGSVVMFNGLQQQQQDEDEDPDTARCSAAVPSLDAQHWLSAIRESGLPGHADPAAAGPLPSPATEWRAEDAYDDTTVVIPAVWSSSGSDWVSKRLDLLLLRDWDLGCVEVVGRVLCATVVLDHFSRVAEQESAGVSRTLRGVSRTMSMSHTARALAHVRRLVGASGTSGSSSGSSSSPSSSSSRTPGDEEVMWGQQLFRSTCATQLMLNEIYDKVGALDSSPTAWNSDVHDRVWSSLRADFDIDGRLAALKHKLSDLDRTKSWLLDTYWSERAQSGNVAIIALITLSLLGHAGELLDTVAEAAEAVAAAMQQQP